MAVETAVEPDHLLGVPVDFILFALTLLGVAIFNGKALRVALLGLAAITLYKLFFAGFKFGTGLAGLGAHMAHEAGASRQPLPPARGLCGALNVISRRATYPRLCLPYCPTTGRAALSCWLIICVLSSFLDNIAAALLGGTIAMHGFQGKVHIGYLAAIVAASNAGGAGSVLGDTTTTMMWIDGVSPSPCIARLRRRERGAWLSSAFPPRFSSNAFSPILHDPRAGHRIDWMRVGIVVLHSRSPRLSLTSILNL